VIELLSTERVRQEIMVDLKGKKVDLVKKILSAMPRSLKSIDPKTLFPFDPNIARPGNVSVIHLLCRELAGEGFDLSVDFYHAVSRALNILIRAGDIRLQIFLGRLDGAPDLGVAFPEELELLRSGKSKT